MAQDNSDIPQLRVPQYPIKRKRGRPIGSHNRPLYSGTLVEGERPQGGRLPANKRDEQAAYYPPPALDDAALDGADDMAIATERLRVLVATGKIVLQALREPAIDLLKRAELGLRAVAAFEGTKSSIALKRSQDDMPRDAAEVEREALELKVKLRRMLEGGDTFNGAVTAVHKLEVDAEHAAITPLPLPE